MELTHKTVIDQWSTVDRHGYEVSVNGSEAVSGDEVNQVGNYNALTKNVCPLTYDRLGRDSFTLCDETMRYHMVESRSL